MILLNVEKGKVTTWKILVRNHAVFWIFIQNITYQKLRIRF